MFKFIVAWIVVVAAIVMQDTVLARPGDFTDAAETVDVPPEHRAAQPAPPQPYPAQPPYQPRAIFPVAAVPGGAQYPLFFTTPNGFVPFASIYSANPQPKFLVPNRPLRSPPHQQIVVAAL